VLKGLMIKYASRDYGNAIFDLATL